MKCRDLRPQSCGRASEQHSDHRHGRLRPRRYRPRRRPAEQRDELTARDHSITSSASASSLSGTIRLRLLAVRRLITNSKFVDCTTGSSAGLAPRMMRLTYIAAWRYAFGTLGP